MDVTFHKTVLLKDLIEGVGVSAYVDGAPVLIYLSDGEPGAVVNRCSHMGSALTGGRIRRGSVICPDHGAIFDLRTGKCAGGIGYLPLRVLDTRVVDGWVEVRTPFPSGLSSVQR